MKNNKTICFIGSGNMGEALISGLLTSGWTAKENIIATDINPKRLRYISKKYGVRVTIDNVDGIKQSDIIILAIKPQIVPELLPRIAGGVSSDKLLISIVAGITTKYFERHLNNVPVIRTMPNTPALLKSGMTAVCRGRFSNKRHEGIAVSIFESVGKVLKLPEKYFDIVTAVSGSGPAYGFYLAESMISAAKQLGLSEAVSQQLVRQTIYGTGSMLSKLDESPGILRAKITSPGGTTEQAIKVFERKHLIDGILKAIERARDRSRELAKK